MWAPRPLIRCGAQNLVVAAGFFLTAWLSLLHQAGDGYVRLIWPQLGLGLAALLLWGVPVAPGIFLGAVAVYLWMGGPVPSSVTMAVGVTVALCCTSFLLRVVHFRTQLDRLQDVFALTALAAPTTAVLVASTDLGVRTLADVEPAGGLWQQWIMVALGSAMGLLIITPVILSLRQLGWPHAIRPMRIVEGVALVACAMVVMVIAIRTPTEVLFLAFPFLIWAAVRFQMRDASLCVLGVSFMAVYAATNRLGQFAFHDFLANMVTVQTFDGAVAFAGLALAASITERNDAHSEISRTAWQLASMVYEIDHRLRPSLPGHHQGTDKTSRQTRPHHTGDEQGRGKQAG